MNYDEYLVNWIREQVKKANFKGVIVGMSGGVDSSVVATLAKKAFPDDSLGVFLPINNMGQDLKDAQLVAKKIEIETTTVDLSKAFKSISSELNISDKLSIANIKPRLRMTALYALAQEKKYLVLGTDNLAEWKLGYFTKYGDGGVDILPIVHLKKGEVKDLAKHFDLPEIIYTKKPTAALWDGQTDEEELGFTYDEVDNYLDGKDVNPETKIKIERQIEVTQHKRDALPTPDTPQAFAIKNNLKQTGKEIKKTFKNIFSK